MTRPSLAAVSWTALGCAVAGMLAVTGLGSVARTEPAPAGVRAVGTPYAVPAPGPLRAPVREAALLVVSDADRFHGPVVRRTDGVAVVERVGIASLPVLGRTVTVMAVDPASFRRLTPTRTATEEAVWDAVARGDAAAAHGVAEGVRWRLGDAVPVGTAGTALRLGAIASTLPGVDVLVNRRRAASLGIPVRNAAVVALRDGSDVEQAQDGLARSLGRAVTVTALDGRPETGLLAARLVGGEVAAAVGSFSYRWSADGSVHPDPAWVAASIVTGDVPILGTVTCHRVMLPALRGALLELDTRGLSGAVDPTDFGGCYAPRFIERDPRRGLSLHTWGIAVDLNVSGNQVGTAGTIDPRVVETFERWGFAWGGRWQVPDPMHFELAGLVSPS